MENEQFTILVPFKGKMAVANVTPVENPIHHFYEVELPGFKTEIFSFEDEYAYAVSRDVDDNDALKLKEFSHENSGWAEGQKGKTDFSVSVGKAIENYQRDGYQPFAINVDDRMLVALGCNDATIMEETYTVYENGSKLFVLHNNDEGHWEISEEDSDPIGNFDERFIQKIGYAIQTITG